jgi:diaminopimelate decarboxylase/aspartate kinase
LISIKDSFPDLRWINLGGGLGVRSRNRELDLVKLNDSLSEFVESGIKIFMEPGRFIVSEAGVLLARATQIRRKGNKNFLGISTGMNSLIRPTLYGAYHGIYNLTRIDERANVNYSVVGPICETGDKLGENRLLPRTKVEDIILIENGGAYGFVMSSNYNMREPASEMILQNEEN